MTNDVPKDIFHRGRRIASIGPFVKGTRTVRNPNVVDFAIQAWLNALRSAGWWITREMLNPLSNMGVCLPDDDDMIGELTAPKHKVLIGAKRAVESKDKIKKRLKRSTDNADAIVYILSGPTLKQLPEIQVILLSDLISDVRKKKYPRSIWRHNNPSLR